MKPDAHLASLFFPGVYLAREGVEDELGGVGCLLLQRVDHVPVRAEVISG